jgi:hypothetical protein
LPKMNVKSMPAIVPIHVQIYSKTGHEPFGTR